MPPNFRKYDWDRIRGNHPTACTCVACDEERRSRLRLNALKDGQLKYLMPTPEPTPTQTPPPPPTQPPAWWRRLLRRPATPESEPVPPLY